MTLNSKELLSLNKEELLDSFGWIDWRGAPDEIFDTFASQLDEDDNISCNEEEFQEDFFVLNYNGTEHRIQLTETESDCYVMICSLAEIIKDKYVVWLEKESAENSDTHGVLIVTKATSLELTLNNSGWVNKHLLELTPGLDMFSGLKIPYYNNYQTNPQFKKQNKKISRIAKRAKIDIQKKRYKPWWKFW